MVKLSKLTPIDFFNLVGIVLAVYLASVLGQTIYQNYMLNRRIETLNGEIGLLKAQQEQLTYSIAYYKTDSFKDREARAKLGLQLPGENVLILPSPAQNGPAVKSGVQAPGTVKSNFGQWIDFLTGKG